MYTETQLNSVIHGDAVDILSKYEDDFVDLVVTSPPYDGIRDYEGYVFEPNKMIKQLYRVLKPGGVVVWVVGDETVDGSETGSSFKQALAFLDIGFKLHDTMIYAKNSSAFPARASGNRYSNVFEYMFVFSKGKPKTANLICDKRNRWAGWTSWGTKSNRDRQGNLVRKSREKPTPQYSPRNNIWYYSAGEGNSYTDDLAKKHPAPFPELLVRDHILTWTNEGDVVLDPMCGSGTTLKVANNMGRRWLGIDVGKSYCEVAIKRAYLPMGAPSTIDIVQRDPEEEITVDATFEGTELRFKLPRADWDAIVHSVLKPYGASKPMGKRRKKAKKN